MSGKQTSWRIVPYEGDAPFKKVRLRHDERIQSLVNYVRRLDYVVVLGAPYSEKTRLLHDASAILQATGLFTPIYINLWAARTVDEASFFGSMANLISRAPGICRFQSRRPILNARDFQLYLEECLKAQDRHIVLLVDHLQTLPQDLVHSLLTALRSILTERNHDRHQLSAVLAGGANLAGFASGPTSPFNIAKRVLVPPLDLEQSRALAEATLAAYGRKASAGGLQRILELVSGDYWLLPLLCAWSSDAVQGYRRDLITRSVVDRAAERVWLTDEALVPIRSAIDTIEEDPDSLLDVLYLLDHSVLPRRQARQTITRTGVDRLQLSGAVVLRQNSYYVKNLVWRQALLRQFTGMHVGQVLRMMGRWRDAIDYLAPRLTSESSAPARADLLEAIVQSIYAADSLEEAYRALVEGLQKGFQLPQVHVYQADAARSTLRLVCPDPGTTDAQPAIKLEELEYAEVQAFHTGEYIVRRGAEAGRLVAALVPERRPIGVVTVEGYVTDVTQHRWPAGMLELQRFLRHAAGAIENVMLRSAYQEIGRAVLDAKAMQPTLERVLTTVTNALGAEYALLYLVNNSETALEVTIGVGRLWRTDGHLPPPLGRSSTHPVAACLSAAMMTASRGPHPQRQMVEPGAMESSAECFRVLLPLIATGSQLGVLEIGYLSSAKTALTEEEKRNLMAFADQVAIAVYNLQLLRRTDAALARRVEEMERLREISLAVSATRKLDAVLGLIIRDLRSLFPGTEATIWKYNDDTQKLTVLQSSLEDPAYRALEMDLTGITGKSIQRERPLSLEDLQTMGSAPIATHARRLGLRGMVALPLISHETVLGAIDVYTTSPTPFSLADSELLEAFAVQAALAIDNAQHYEALRLAQLELEDNRERELFDLASALLHRLDNVVGDVPHWLRRAHDRARAGADVAEPLAHLETRMTGLRQLREPLKTLVDLREFERTAVDLCEVIRDVAEQARSWHGVTPNISTPSSPVLVLGNRALLSDALQSVVENACEAMEGQGKLRIYLSRSADELVEIRVTDNGPGIPEDIRSRVFEPGFSTRTSPDRERGKGLFTCSAILHKHRGTISVESKPYKETTFTIKMPALAPVATDARVAGPSAREEGWLSGQAYPPED